MEEHTDMGSSLGFLAQSRESGNPLFHGECGRLLEGE